jgi:predicted DNA-binding protein YlxM (UPF0122 family)
MPKHPPKDRSHLTPVPNGPTKEQIAAMLLNKPTDSEGKPLPPNKVLNRHGEVVDHEDVYGDDWPTAQDASSNEDSFSHISEADNQNPNNSLKRSRTTSTNIEKSNRSPYKLLRQEKVFQLHALEGLSNDEIAAKLGVHRDTVASDLKAEQELRMTELELTRDAQLVNQLMLVQRVINSSYEDRKNKGTGAYAAHTEALKQRAKLLGLDAAVKIDLGFATILDAINILPTEVEQKGVYEKIVSGQPLITGPGRIELDAYTQTITVEGEVTKTSSDNLVDLERELSNMPDVPTIPSSPEPSVPPSEEGDAPFQELFSEVKAIEARHDFIDTYNVEQAAHNDAVRAGTIKPEQAEGVIVGEPVAIDPQAELLRSTKSGAQALLDEAQRVDGVKTAMGNTDRERKAARDNVTAERFGVDPLTGKKIVPPTPADPIAIGLAESQRAAKAAADAKIAQQLATTTRDGHLPGTPVEATRQIRPPAKDKAASVMLEPWFLLLTPQVQAETVKAIRLAAAQEAASETPPDC